MTIYHTHHIIPKHAGGTDDPSNLIRLTVEEHAEAHRKLYEEHGRWQDELAWRLLSSQIGKEEAYRRMLQENGRRVGKLRRKHTQEQKEHFIQKGIEWHKDPSNYEKKLEQIANHCHSLSARKKRGKSISKLKWCNDGTNNYRLKEVPEGYNLGRI
jgi:hypothetical protein